MSPYTGPNKFNLSIIKIINVTDQVINDFSSV